MNSIVDKKLEPLGIYTAALTPLHPDLKINFSGLIRHCRNLLDRGTDGIALLGTTGEANTFSVEERIGLIDAVAASDLPKTHIMIGTGCCALPDTLRLSRHALDHGFGKLLVLPPFYYKNLTDEGLEQYFSKLIEAIGPGEYSIILYNFPKLTGVPFSMQLLEKLIGRYPSVIAGIKDSSGDFENMRRMCSGFPGFAVFAGTEKYLLDILKQGGAGCISATANVTCDLAAEIYRAFTRGLTPEAKQAHLTEIRTTMDAYPLIGMLKRMMADREHEAGWAHIRPPNVLIPEPDFMALSAELKQIGFL